MFRSMLVLVLAMVVVAPVTAQTNVLVPGERIRVAVGAGASPLTHAGMPAAPRTTLTGMLVSLSADSLRLRGESTVRSLPVPEVLRIERFAGRRSYKLRGFLIGTAIGVAGGAAVGAISRNACFEVNGNCSIGGAMLDSGFVFGALGGLVGFLFGVPSHDQWDAVPRPWQPAGAQP